MSKGPGGMAVRSLAYTLLMAMVLWIFLIQFVLFQYSVSTDTCKRDVDNILGEVRSAYQEELGRDPDFSGTLHYLNGILLGQFNPSQLRDFIHHSDEAIAYRSRQALAEAISGNNNNQTIAYKLKQPHQDGHSSIAISKSNNNEYNPKFLSKAMPQVHVVISMIHFHTLAL
jgi:hypothetical protein